jgi:OOP family OmpA-OmpF porin
MPLLHRRTLPLLLAGAAGCSEQPAPPSNLRNPRPIKDWNALLFFEWDSAQITARARQLFPEFKENLEEILYPYPNSLVIIMGHADRSGPAAYNLVLSRRRAEAAAAEWARLGYFSQVPIRIEAYGEERPLAPTPDGVREPLNRRVEIWFR